jgi:hypothetical protein
MSLKDRIFDLVFPDRRRRRTGPDRPANRRRRRKDAEEASKSDGYDDRYFIRRRK